MPTKLNYQALLKNLKPRAKDAHKNDFGHVLVIGGGFGYPGAPILAALGALRAGAGLVSVASHATTIAGLNGIHPEIMTTAIDNPAALSTLIPKASVVVLGPGLGRTAWSQEVFDIVMHYDLPTVIDADGLYFVSQSNYKPKPLVITPHPGEASTLLRYKVGASNEERLQACSKLIQQENATVVLKGAGTLVGSPDSEIGICEHGNPGMATAGMGDLLSGIIAALIAQGLSLDLAAKLGVCVHAMAGDEAAKSGQRGMIATDLLPYIRGLLASF